MQFWRRKLNFYVNKKISLFSKRTNVKYTSQQTRPVVVLDGERERDGMHTGCCRSAADRRGERKKGFEVIPTE